MSRQLTLLSNDDETAAAAAADAETRIDVIRGPLHVLHGTHQFD